MTTRTYPVREPVEPWHDWRTYSMFVPIMSGTIGACIFMAMGFSFTEIATIGVQWRTFLVILASFTVAFGSTFGSVGSGIEIFRKVFSGQAILWDWISLAVSITTTVAGFAMGFAALMGATTQWAGWAQIVGPLVVGTLAALDSGGDMIELGGLFGSFAVRYEQWWQDRESWYESHGIVEPIDRSAWPIADLSAIRRLAAELNGERAGVRMDNLQDYLDREGLLLPDIGDTTRRRWVNVLRNGG